MCLSAHRAVPGVALILLAVTPPLAAELDVQATIASDYVHRALLQTDSGGAVQGSMEYRWTAGWFAGVWASRVDFAYDDRDAEVDVYGGYGRRLSRRLAVEAAFIHYGYRGDSPRDDDWDELQVTAHVGDYWTITAAAAENWWGAGGRSGTLEGSVRYPLPWRITVDTTVGYQFADRAVGVDYAYAEGGLSRPFGPLLARLAYSAAGTDARRRFGAVADDRFIVSLTWQP